MYFPAKKRSLHRRFNFNFLPYPILTIFKLSRLTNGQPQAPSSHGGVRLTPENYIRSKTSIPNKDNPSLRVRAVKSASMRREVRFGSSACKTGQRS